jgi:hypothetical protein
LAIAKLLDDHKVDKIGPEGYFTREIEEFSVKNEKGNVRNLQQCRDDDKIYSKCKSYFLEG